MVNYISFIILGGNNTLELWKKESPEDLIKKADKNWELVKNKK